MLHMISIYIAYIRFGNNNRRWEVSLCLGWDLTLVKSRMNRAFKFHHLSLTWLLTINRSIFAVLSSAACYVINNLIQHSVGDQNQGFCMTALLWQEVTHCIGANWPEMRWYAMGPFCCLYHVRLAHSLHLCTIHKETAVPSLAGNTRLTNQRAWLRAEFSYEQSTRIYRLVFRGSNVWC